MGVVYLGRDRTTENSVAVKMLSDAGRSRSSANTQHLVERFKREIATTKRLNHPNIVQVLSDGETDDGMPFVVLEYLEGWDLREVLDDEEKLSPRRAAHIGLGIAKALEESHRIGIVHRDLKPENVFLVQTAHGEIVKVLDFGIARLTDEEEERLTVAGTALGTPRYMAPEQVMDTGFYPTTDIYSFGIVLFEMLSGTIPFWAENDLDLALKHVHESPPILDVEGMEIGLLQSWQELISKLLKKPHSKRPSAAMVAQQLQALLARAIETQEVRPDKETQILRFDIHATAAQGANYGARPTRVLGVRTAPNRAIPKSPAKTGRSTKPPTTVVPRPATVEKRKQSTASIQRQPTDKTVDPQRAATDDLEHIQRAATDDLEHLQRAATDDLEHLQRAATDELVNDDDAAWKASDQHRDDPRRSDTDTDTDTLNDVQRAATDELQPSTGHVSAISNRVPRSRVKEAMRSGTEVIAVPAEIDASDDVERRASRNALILIAAAIALGIAAILYAL